MFKPVTEMTTTEKKNFLRRGFDIIPYVNLDNPVKNEKANQVQKALREVALKIKAKTKVRQANKSYKTIKTWPPPKLSNFHYDLSYCLILGALLDRPVIVPFNKENKIYETTLAIHDSFLVKEEDINRLKQAMILEWQRALFSNSQPVIWQKQY